MIFMLVQDASMEIILRNFFIVSFTIDDIDIPTKIKGREVIFKLEFPKQKNLISSLKGKILKK